jgi:hypothetical protein
MRTKGKLKYDETCLKIFGRGMGGCDLREDDFTVADIRGWGHLQYLGAEKAFAIQKANAEHLVYCWNAFEQGGIVERMAGVLKEAREGNGVSDENTWRRNRVIAVLLKELEAIC